MRFVRFKINNFKGIKSAELNLVPAGNNVFTLIGLNESGKTTVLEAIDDFGANSEGTEALYGAERASEHASFVPKHLKANFTGDVTIEALLRFDDGEIDAVIEEVYQKAGAKISKESVPKELKVVRGYRFVNSDYDSRIHTWATNLYGKKKGDRSEKEILINDVVGKVFVASVNRLVPKVVYFPTFLFSTPAKIVLNPDGDDESDVNRLYRQIIQDIASSLDSPLDVKTHIVDRMLSEQSAVQQLLNMMMLAPDKQQQINATLNALSAHLTKTVFDSWGKIFSGNFKGREIYVRLGVDNSDGRQEVYLWFVLKDGATEYDVSERSLGFRWFFSFLLFTLYRVYAKGSRGSTLFLLDEPASNLHARAQMQLLDSFARIAGRSNGIMYSTHSHYMIKPEWLDQAFVVSNKAIDYEGQGEENGFVSNSPTEVIVERYRAFVAKNPGKTTYFQPVLDKLEVVPSRLDIMRPSVLVEGKGDFFILEYGLRVMLKPKKSHVSVVPTRGAAGMDELIGLFLGWGVNFLICLDADKAGKEARKRYLAEWGLSSSRVMTLEEVEGVPKGAKIEDLLSPDDIKLVSDRLQIVGKPTKSQIQLFFSEALAREERLPMSDAYLKRIEAFQRAVSGALMPPK
ncbi:AAA family ATPase [Lysobacter sp. cf310]|uniref:AAA family ATPase n=1 Tax=Lysobacter sp. cf310 TaxID=1761790 RepID=UPI0008E862FC|nr:AAA family ATPase [Lysobacter sp. cf310]SFK69800.1 Predicted ATP-dependent endonuclease of the OLD family, contains P-loop ATPase and TOPRIM domains [Lysobacter sp. cf310]